jgi:hypothetical protein
MDSEKQPFSQLLDVELGLGGMKYLDHYFDQLEVYSLSLHAHQPSDASLSQIVEKLKSQPQRRNALHALLLDSRLLSLALVLALGVLAIEIYALVVRSSDTLIRE